MKSLVVLVLTLFSSHLLAQPLEFKWSKLSMAQKVASLEAIKHFLKTDAKDQTLAAVDPATRLKWHVLLFDEAWAQASFKPNCFYAGWPSQQVSLGDRKVCSSPAKSNPWYQTQKEKCGAGKLLCNPLLFGEALCIPNATTAERQSSFSNCQKAFSAANRSMESVAKLIDASPELQMRLEELLRVLADACAPEGYQGRSGMCGLLKTRVAGILENRQPTNPTPDASVAVSDSVTVSDVLTTLEDVKTTVTSINNPDPKRLCFDAIAIPEPDKVKGPWELSTPIDQAQSTPKDYCFNNENGTNLEKYSQTKHWDDEGGGQLSVTFLKDKGSEEPKSVEGIRITADKFGKEAPYVEEGVAYPEDSPMVPHRNYDYDFDGRNKEATFVLLDWPVKEIYNPQGKVIERSTSTDLRMTNYMFFPRKVVPSAARRDDKIYMTLVTGEKVIFDAKTGKVIGGAFEEKEKVNVETRPREKRFYPPASFNYRGEGMWLEAPVTNDKDYRKPGSLIPLKSVVNGVESKCNMPSEELYEYNWGYRLPQGSEGWLNSGWTCYKFKFETDQALYEAVKKKCPTFKFPPLTQ